MPHTPIASEDLLLKDATLEDIVRYLHGKNIEPTFRFLPPRSDVGGRLEGAGNGRHSLQSADLPRPRAVSASCSAMPLRRTRQYADYATAASIVILMLALVPLAGSIRHIWDSWRWVIHTREVLERVQATVSLIHEAESLQKSVLISHDADDRAAFERTLDTLPQAVRILQRSTSDNPRQQQALGIYRNLLDEHARGLRSVLARHADGAALLPEEWRRQAAMRTAILRQAGALRAEEQRLLALRENQVGADQRRVVAAVAAVAGLAIALLVLLRWFAQRDAAILLDERARLDAILRSIGDAVIAVDRSERVRFMNPVAEQLIGLSEAEAEGRLFHEVFRFDAGPGGGDAQIGPLLRLAMETNAPRTNVALRGAFHGRPDARQDLIVGCYPVLVRGRPGGAVIAGVDVTSLKEAQRGLNEANQQLEQRVQERTEALAEANLELRAFAHTVAHDLRAPLRNIHGFADALIEDEAARLSGTGRRFLERIADGVDRLDRMTTDLLDYSKLSRSEVRRGRVELGRVVQLALQDLSHQAAAVHALVEVAQPLPAVLAHEALLVQVFDNLVGNALKFVAPGTVPHVRIRARETDEWVEVEVADNGIGIALSERERVFGVFERLHGQEGYAGSGIGLAIVRRAVERMGGSVRIIDPADGGTVFVVSLRAAPAERPVVLREI
jgi:signal transduction histidine kinase